MIDLNLNKIGEDTFLVGEQMAVTLNTSDAGAEASSLMLSDDTDNVTGDYHNWGEDNNWPTNVRLLNEKSTTSYPMIAKQIGLLFGEGVSYYTEEIVDGKKVKNYGSIEAVDTFFENNDIDRFMLERMMDYKFFGNIFCEFLMSKHKQEINNVNHLEAEFTRLSVQNTKSKVIEKIGLLADWTESGTPIEIELLNPKKSDKETVFKQFKKKKKFALHSTFPSPGRTYYAVPPHIAIYRKDGWLEYSNGIPLLLNKMIKNQVTLKYHIQIPYSYWQTVHKEWDNLTQEKRDEHINGVMLEMDTWLKDKSNDFKSFKSHFATDPVTGKPLAGWKIEAIDDKLKKDDYIPVAQEADAQIVRAIGIDPSLAGLQPQGGKMGAGSGSDKRVSYNNSVFITKVDAKIIFEPLYFVKRYNNWPKSLKFEFGHQAHTTTDESKSGISTENI